MATTRESLNAAKRLLAQSSFKHACILAPNVCEDGDERVEVFALDVASVDVVKVSRELNSLLFPLVISGHTFVSVACDTEDSVGIRDLLESGDSELWSPTSWLDIARGADVARLTKALREWRDLCTEHNFSFDNSPYSLSTPPDLQELMAEWMATSATHWDWKASLSVSKYPSEVSISTKHPAPWDARPVTKAAAA